MVRDDTRFRQVVVLLLGVVFVAFILVTGISDGPASSLKGTNQGGSRGTTGGIAVLAALGGGATGAVATHLFSLRRDNRAKSGERNGLLLLLYEDIQHNRRQLREFEKHSSWITDAPPQSIRTVTWQEARFRLAQLMDNEEFGDIAQYFNNLIEIDKYRLGETSPETNNIDIQQSIPKHFPTLDEQGRTALEHINKYIAKPRQDLDPSE